MIKVTHWGEDYATIKVGTKEFEVSIEIAKAIERQTKTAKNKVIEYYSKEVYGLEKLYVADENTATIISNLTGRKTLSTSDIGALNLLGFTLKQVLKPTK